MFGATLKELCHTSGRTFVREIEIVTQKIANKVHSTTKLLE